MVVQAVAVTSGKRKEAPAPVQRGNKTAEALSAPKRQFVVCLRPQKHENSRPQDEACDCDC